MFCGRKKKIAWVLRSDDDFHHFYGGPKNINSSGIYSADPDLSNRKAGKPRTWTLKRFRFFQSVSAGKTPESDRKKSETFSGIF